MSTTLQRPCRDEAHDGLRWLPATTEFFDRGGTLADGSPKLASYCKPCARRRTRARQRGQARIRTAYFRAYRRDVIQADEEKRADRNEYQRTRARDASPHPRPHLWMENRGDRYMDADPLRLAIQTSDLTPTELERRAGLGEGTVRKALKRSRVRVPTGRAILRVLGLTPGEVGL